MTDTQIESPAKPPKGSRGGLFVALRRRVRETVSEMRKVLWPSRQEMTTYTLVVIVFVTFMVALVAGLDYGFAKAVLAIFG